MRNKIDIYLTAEQAKALIINDGLSFFWKNRIYDATLEAVDPNQVAISVLMTEIEDLLMHKVRIPDWFFKMVLTLLFDSVTFKG